MPYQGLDVEVNLCENPLWMGLRGSGSGGSYGGRVSQRRGRGDRTPGQEGFKRSP